VSHNKNIQIPDDFCLRGEYISINCESYPESFSYESYDVSSLSSLSESEYEIIPEDYLLLRKSVGMKKLLCELWVLLGRNAEIPCLLLHLEGFYLARRLNDVCWLVRKAKRDNLNFQSPFFMILPDDLVLELPDSYSYNKQTLDYSKS